MLEQIISFVIHLLTSLLVVVVYMRGFKKKLLSSLKPDDSWEDASAMIENLKKRCHTLYERDLAMQERLWNVEDQNRVLKLHIADMRRETVKKKEGGD